jgi:hypothetical protein
MPRLGQKLSSNRPGRPLGRKDETDRPGIAVIGPDGTEYCSIAFASRKTSITYTRLYRAVVRGIEWRYKNQTQKLREG